LIADGFIMRFALPALIGAALFLCGLPARAAPGDDIGAAVRIINLVTAAYKKDERNLSTGDSVRQDDLIEVSSDGLGEIKLRDDTELALGRGSRLLLDKFVYNPDISGGAIVLNLVKGAFRFITGVAAKPAYIIRTPTASITVRGTIFDVYVQTSGVSWLLLIEGAIEVCNENDECGLLDEPGKLIRITPSGDLGDPVKWADLETDGLPFATAFPFVVTPPQIDPTPFSRPATSSAAASPRARPTTMAATMSVRATMSAPGRPIAARRCAAGTAGKRCRAASTRKTGA
jgi:FecR protein